MEGHGDAGGSYEFCMESGVTLRYDVSKSDPLPRSTIKNNIFFPRHAKSSKITICRANSGAVMLTLAKRWSREVQLRSTRADKCPYTLLLFWNISSQL